MKAQSIGSSFQQTAPKTQQTTNKHALPGSFFVKGAIILLSLCCLLPAFASKHISFELIKLELSPVVLPPGEGGVPHLPKPQDQASITPLAAKNKAAANTGSTPKSLLVYYGWPSSFNYNNNFWDLSKVAADFSRYDLIVLGAGLELTSHGDHTNTGSILSIIDQQLAASGRTIRIFGYLDLGRSTNNYPQAEIEQRIDLWRQLLQGYSQIDAGIFFDDYGYDFGTDRTRQTPAVNYAKSRALTVIVNAWDPDDVFGADINTNSYAGIMMNPDGNPPPDDIDYYLSESFVIQNSNWAGQTTLENKQAKLTAYQASYQPHQPMQVLSLTTNTGNYSFSQQKFNYAWHYASLYNHAAFGWGEPAFSSNAVAPFRSRPSATFDFPPQQAPQATGSGPCIYREPTTGFHGVMIHPQAHVSVTALDLNSLLNNLNSAFSSLQCQY